MLLHLIEGITKSDHALCKKCDENLNYVKKKRAVKRHGIALRCHLYTSCSLSFPLLPHLPPPRSKLIKKNKFLQVSSQPKPNYFVNDLSYILSYCLYSLLLIVESVLYGNHYH